MTAGRGNGVPRYFSMAQIRVMQARASEASTVALTKCATAGCETYACEYHARLHLRDATDGDGVLVCVKQCYPGARRAHLAATATAAPAETP